MRKRTERIEIRLTSNEMVMLAELMSIGERSASETIRSLIHGASNVLQLAKEGKGATLQELVNGYKKQLEDDKSSQAPKAVSL